MTKQCDQCGAELIWRSDNPNDVITCGTAWAKRCTNVKEKGKLSACQIKYNRKTSYGSMEKEVEENKKALEEIRKRYGYDVNQEAERTCLRCDKSFNSQSIGNRTCDHCKLQQEGMKITRIDTSHIEVEADFMVPIEAKNVSNRELSDLI